MLRRVFQSNKYGIQTVRYSISTLKTVTYFTIWSERMQEVFVFHVQVQTFMSFNHIVVSSLTLILLFFVVHLVIEAITVVEICIVFCKFLLPSRSCGSCYYISGGYCQSGIFTFLYLINYFLRF